MSVVAALKQYAEDRNMVILCGALNDVLDTKSQRNVLTHIRLLIPPVKRPQFDELMSFNRSQLMPLNNDSTGTVSAEIAHHLGHRKVFQVVREADSFGFVIRSSCPAFIESVDPGGAAEKAGLQAGDYLIKLNGIDVRETDHDRLIELLRDSGSSPTLEVLRCGKAASSSNSTVSSSSSLSSHSSVDNILFGGAITDKDGNTFTEKAQFLLTPKEQNILKRAIRNYIIKKDIIELHRSVSAILDAPSKRMLWTFVFVLLSTPHREYVSHHVNIPFDILMAEKKANLDSDKPDLEDFPPSFEQHADFLLTNAEKFQFKKSLEMYKRNQ
ncbi:unnamed protein product [Candidula unifasciata]|uniref:PDZ domain-containing protein n=1 Tax=Candidula unifasciata TaxID=100452 RepID=A0A8S3ZC07_9EUPU|nr:unnamed protein product [Candidula unifasciata]